VRDIYDYEAMNSAAHDSGSRVLLIALISVALSGCAELEVGAGRMTVSEKMMWSTYAIATSKGMATCVIINRRDPSAPRGVTPVLVTAGHVLAAAPHGPYFLAVRTPNPGGNPNLAIMEFKPAWFSKTAYTKNPRHDIAVLELRIPDELANEIDLPSFIDEEEIARRGDEPHPGESVCVLGYPRVFPGTEGGFAILRDGKIASYSPGTPHNGEKFLINTYAYSGDSGGPVFADVARGRRPELLGLLTERIGEKPGQVPLAVAVNASVIRETLQLLSKGDRQSVEKKLSNARRGSKARTGTGSAVKLAAPPSVFVKIVRGKRPAALPIPAIPCE
jgi:Trypsin-like peptidase domain